MSQKDLILNYMREGNAITPLQAFNYFSCLRLGAIIYNLKHEGYKIGKEKVVLGRAGRPYAKYKLLDTRNKMKGGI